jgi:hypothetical protein
MPNADEIFLVDASYSSHVIVLKPTNKSFQDWFTLGVAFAI